MVDDRNALRRPIGFVHVVRRQEHGDALGFIEVPDVRPQLIPRLRIQSERRLVEKQDSRRVKQTACNLEPAFHPARKLLHRSVAPIPQLEQLEQQLDPFTPNLARHVIQHAVQVHVLVGGQLVVEARILEHDPEPPARVERTRHRIEAIKAHRSAGGMQQRRQHLDRRGLAGAVRSQKGEHFARVDVERHAVNGAQLAKCLDEVLYSNHLPSSPGIP